MAVIMVLAHIGFELGFLLNCDPVCYQTRVIYCLLYLQQVSIDRQSLGHQHYNRQLYRATVLYSLLSLNNRFRYHHVSLCATSAKERL